jgi:hypothetical protein
MIKRAPLELTPEVARRFFEDMRARASFTPPGYRPDAAHLPL